MSLYQRPWYQVGNTACITANNTAPTGVQVLPGAPFGNEPTTGGGSLQFRCHNSGTVIIHLGYGATASDAVNNANTAASSGSPQPALPLAPGLTEILTLPRQYYFSAKAGAATSVYITPGKGV